MTDKSTVAPPTPAPIRRFLCIFLGLAFFPLLFITQVRAQGFTNVSTATGTNDTGNGDAGAWGDYDGDGDLDLFLSNGGTTDRLYRNDGSGSFAEVGATANVAFSGYSAMGVWGDYDNDDDLDLFVSSASSESILYRNEGNNTFTNISAAVGIVGSTSGGSAAWGDYDGDGDLDLYMSRSQSNSALNRLFRNDGSTFAEVGSAVGVDDALDGRGVAFADYDGDGDLDLYAASVSNNKLYRNDGVGAFVNVAATSGVDNASDARASVWGDYDNDADLDLYLVNVSAANKLYRNDGGSSFVEVSVAAGVNDGGTGQGANWGDYDNDGDLDLYVANFSGQANKLYRNDGAGVFAEVGVGLGVDAPGNGIGVSWGDYDDNGFVDLYVANFSGQANQLFRNDGNGNNWLHVKLIGSSSNRSAIGAKVQATIGSSVQMAQVDGGSGYGHASLPVEFGLGSATSIDQLTVEWPSGITQTLANVATNQTLTITEQLPPRLRLATPLAFYSNLVGNQDIYSIQADGSGQTQLTTNAANDVHPKYSPQGDRMAFVSERDGNREVYIMDADGSNQIRLTNEPGMDWGPSFSPDGSRIVFGSERDGDHEIYIMDVDGSNQTRLTDNSSFDAFPSFSPDGSRIVFESERNGNREIYLMDAAGSNQKRLTNNSVFDGLPSFSPDSTHIVYESHLNGHREVYIMDTDGSNQTRITTNTVSSYHPHYSADGGYVSYASDIDGSRDIYVMSIDGADLQQLTNNGAENNDPDWRSFTHIGTAGIGASITRTMTVENTGSGALNVSNISFDSGSFSALPTAFTVPSGGTQDVDVIFSPLALDTQYATMTIVNNDPANSAAQMIVNGTGTPSILGVSIANIQSPYASVVQVPVEITDPSGTGIVAAEIFVAYDGDLISAFSAGLTGTLAENGWSIQTNIVQGNSSNIDTIKIAMATDNDVLVGDGDLVNLSFQVADIRIPASTPLTLSHVLFNDGVPTNTATDGSLTIIGADGTITSLLATIIPRETITITVVDADADLISGAGNDQVSVTVENTHINDSVSLTLNEDGTTAGTFVGTIETEFGTAIIADALIQAKNGDAIVSTYTDVLDSNGNGPTDRTAQTDVIGGVNGSVEITIVSQPGDPLYIQITDADLNTSFSSAQTASVTVENTTTNDIFVVELTEADDDDDVFFGSLPTTAGASTGTELGTVEDDIVTVTYDDVVTLDGDQRDRTDINDVIFPWGDADDNDVLQAFDAAKILVHVLNGSPIDEQASNVDDETITSGINPFDASLVLQKRVGLIATFPVQDPTSENHPQGAPGTPKLVPETRALSLAAGEGYLSLYASEREGLLAGDLTLQGITGRVEMGVELADYLTASKTTDEGLRIVFAGAEAASGSGELLRIYGMAPGAVELTDAVFNNGNITGTASGLTTIATPTSFVLHPNVPNPFNPETTLRFELPQAAEVKLEVFDALGQKVRTLVSGALQAGAHSAVWNGSNDAGNQVGNGVYLYRLQAGEFNQVRRMLLLK